MYWSIIFRALKSFFKLWNKLMKRMDFYIWNNFQTAAWIILNKDISMQTTIIIFVEESENILRFERTNGRLDFIKIDVHIKHYELCCYRSLMHMPNSKLRLLLHMRNLVIPYLTWYNARMLPGCNWKDSRRLYKYAFEILCKNVHHITLKLLNENKKLWTSELP